MQSSQNCLPEVDSGDESNISPLPKAIFGPIEKENR